MKRLFLTLVLLVTTMLTASAQYFPVDTARLNKTYRTLLQKNIIYFFDKEGIKPNIFK